MLHIGIEFPNIDNSDLGKNQPTTKKWRSIVGYKQTNKNKANPKKSEEGKIWEGRMNGSTRGPERHWTFIWLANISIPEPKAQNQQQQPKKQQKRRDMKRKRTKQKRTDRNKNPIKI